MITQTVELAQVVYRTGLRRSKNITMVVTLLPVTHAANR